MVDKQKLSIAIRSKRGKMTLREASAESGIPLNTLYRIERGLGCGFETAVKLSRWIGVPVDYFVLEAA